MRALFRRLIIIYVILLSPLMASANSITKFSEAMLATVSFSNFVPKTSGQLTKTEYQKLEKLLQNAFTAALAVDSNEIRSILGPKFVSEWKLFTRALEDRLIGWRRADKELSAKGVKGMMRFQSYYSKNLDEIKANIAKLKKEKSWF